MSLSNSLVEQFVKVTTNDDETTKETTVYGTIVKSGNSDFVQLDGSELLTPVTSTISVKDGDRVTVMIKNHTAIVTGNITDPSASNSATEEIGNKINEFEIVIADKVSADELEVEKGRIDDLITDTVLIKEELVANEAIIEDLQADNVTIKGDLTAVNGEIQNLKTTKLDAEVANLKFATIENLEATNAEIHNLDADYGNFKVTTTETLSAVNASIENLDAEKLDAEQANLMYANIDFANIGKLAIENFFSKSGMIDDLVVGDGTVTGKLVGVTIIGDLIEGGTVKADKLVVQGSDGLYYKLNVTGETVAAEQTEYNSLNGSIITAKSITAEKVNVNDLVAFGATIGGFKITDSSIYSGTKETATNTTRGIYMDDTGQLSIGDSNNYLRYFQTEDGEWKLEISTQQTNVEIGGTNLFLNSRFNENVYYWTTEAGDEMPEVEPEPEPEPEPVIPEPDGVNLFVNSKFDPSAGGNFPENVNNQTSTPLVDETYGSWTVQVGSYLSFGFQSEEDTWYGVWTSGGFGTSVTLFQDVSSKINETNSVGYYTISFNTMVTGDAFEGVVRFYITGCEYQIISGSIETDVSTLNPSSSERKALTINITSITDDIKIGLELEPDQGSSYIVYFNQLKLEKGIVESTEWTAAPEDLEDGVNLFLGSSFSEYSDQPSFGPGEDSGSVGSWEVSTHDNGSLNIYSDSGSFEAPASGNASVEIVQDVSDKITETYLNELFTISGDFAALDDSGNLSTPNYARFYITGCEYEVPYGTFDVMLVPGSEYVYARHYAIFKITSITGPIKIGLAFHTENYYSIYGFKNLKLEKGYNTNPTWTAAPEDTASLDISTFAETDETTDTTDDGTDEQELKSIDIATIDGIPCAVMNSESSSYIYQNVATRLVTEDNSKVYIFSADLNLVDYVAGTAPEIKLYLEGKYADSAGTLQDVIATTVSGNSDITAIAGQGWTRVNWIISLNAIPSYTNSLDYLNAGIKGSDFGGNLYFKNLKFEKGNTPTDWSPSPEDYSNEIDDAVNESANAIKDQYTAMINQAADQINLIVQQLQQTTTQQGTTISNISNQLQITSDMAQFVKTTVETLQDVVDGKIDSVTIEEWARFDGASLELGTSDSPFKCLLTNTELAFYQGDNKVAWISNNELHVLTAVIATSIGCGNFMWIDEGELGFSLV